MFKLFEEKVKCRMRLGLLWEDLVKVNKKEAVRLDVLVRNNKDEHGHLEDQLRASRANLKKASEESESLDRQLEKVMREREGKVRVKGNKVVAGEREDLIVKEKVVKGEGEKAGRGRVDESPLPHIIPEEKKPVVDDASTRAGLELNIVKYEERIEEGRRNLTAHKKELVKMTEMKVSEKLCEAKAKEIENYEDIHRKCIERLGGRIEMLQARLGQPPPNSAQDFPIAVSSTSTSHIHRPSHGRKLEAVEVVEEKKRKLSVKEKEMIVPKVFKVDTDPESSDEDESYPAYSCSHCPRHLSSATTLVSHMEKHFPPGSLLTCPFPRCIFSSDVEGLTRQARQVQAHWGEALPLLPVHLQVAILPRSERSREEAY